jgi:hypothetical protein
MYAHAPTAIKTSPCCLTIQKTCFKVMARHHRARHLRKINIKPRYVRVTHLRAINVVVRHVMIMHVIVRNEREMHEIGKLCKYEACKGKS